MSYDLVTIFCSYANLLLLFRFVSAWSHLTNAVYDPTTPFTWRGHSMVHVVADEDGLWVIFPARDPFDPYATLTYVINKINPVDLRILESHKSKIRWVLMLSQAT